MAGYKYFWTCPNCRTTLQLKMRVTQTTRKCPQCGFVVTPEEIDRQKWYGAIASLIIVGFIWLLCATPAGTITNLFYGLVQLVIGIIVIAVIAFVGYIAYKVYEQRAFDTKKVEFLSSPDFQLVRDFARSELRHENGANEKLLNILQNKEWNFTPEQMNTFVEEESKTQIAAKQSAIMAEQAARIADQIRAKSPDNREAYLRAYIEVSHPHENDYLHVIADFLKVSESEYPKLKDELVNLSKKSDLDEFERRLRDGSGL